MVSVSTDDIRLISRMNLFVASARSFVENRTVDSGGDELNSASTIL